MGLNTGQGMTYSRPLMVRHGASALRATINCDLTKQEDWVELLDDVH